MLADEFDRRESTATDSTKTLQSADVRPASPASSYGTP